jgi:hypothetical protein
MVCTSFHAHHFVWRRSGFSGTSSKTPFEGMKWSKSTVGWGSLRSPQPTLERFRVLRRFAGREDAIPAGACSEGNVFLHGQSGGALSNLVDGLCGPASGRGAGGVEAPSFLNRWHRDSSGSSPCLLDASAGDHDYSMSRALIKAGLSRRIPGGERCSKSWLAKVERGIWQRRYREHLNRDEVDYEKHVDTI